MSCVVLGFYMCHQVNPLNPHPAEKLCQPRRKLFHKHHYFPVSILCDRHRAILIIKQGCFVTVWQNAL